MDAARIGSEMLAGQGSAQVEPAAAPAADAHHVYLPFAASPGATSATNTITLNGDSITADASGVSVTGTTATITAAGTYTVSGALHDGQLAVDGGDEDVVTLVLNGANIANSTNAAINVVNAKDVILVLADGSANTVTDAATYVFADPTEDEPNAAIFSKADLTIGGSGSLNVTGNYNDGIAGKDDLVIQSGTISVKAADDGMRGKDSLVIENGAITVTAGGDGLKSDEEEDAAKGYVAVENGSLTIVAGGDAIAAQTNVTIDGGQFTLTSGGGSSAALAADASAKGIKGGAGVTLNGGTFAIDAAEDGIHANVGVTITGGTYTIASGDDGIHADANITVEGGDIRITRSFEGVEGNLITLNNGAIRIVASDDGVNVPGAGDNAGQPLSGGAETAAYWLYINGGYLSVYADGDGLDANGSIGMTGGTVIVHGPTQNMNAAVDYDGVFNMAGGVLAAAGSAGMAQAPSVSSSQNSLLVNFNTALAAGTLVHIEDSGGNSLLTYAPAKSYQSLAFSSPQLASGGTYRVYIGGSAAGAAVDGVYSGAYTPGQQYTSFTVTSRVTQIGGGGGRP